MRLAVRRATTRPPRTTVTVTRAARVRITVARGRRVVARRTVNSAGNRTYRLAVKPSARGVYRVRITVGGVRETLTARKL